MARTKKTDTIPSKGLTVTIPEPLADFYEEIRWSKRASRSGLMAEVLEAWAVDNGYTVPEAPEGE